MSWNIFIDASQENALLFISLNLTESHFNTFPNAFTARP